MTKRSERKTGRPVKMMKPGRPINEMVKKGSVRLCEEGLAMIKEEAAAAAAEALNKKKRKTKAARLKVETCKEGHYAVAQCVTAVLGSMAPRKRGE